MKKYIVEAIGTFAIVFIGTGSILMDRMAADPYGLYFIATAFSGIIFLVILPFAGISGAHFNPAVTIGFACVNKFPPGQVVPYIISQLTGAILASAMLKFATADPQSDLGITLPSVTATQAFIYEVLLTFFLVISIMICSKLFKQKILGTAAVVGVVIFIEIMIAGPITGASMNPARSFAPALISGHFEHLLIYIFAPITGAIIAMFAWKWLVDKN